MSAMVVSGGGEVSGEQMSGERGKCVIRSFRRRHSWHRETAARAKTMSTSCAEHLAVISS